MAALGATARLVPLRGKCFAFDHPVSSTAAKVMAAVLNDFKPNIEAQRRLIARRSCSTMLLIAMAATTNDHRLPLGIFVA